jgi:hypothetical protein
MKAFRLAIYIICNNNRPLVGYLYIEVLFKSIAIHLTKSLRGDFWSLYRKIKDVENVRDGLGEKAIGL